MVKKNNIEKIYGFNDKFSEDLSKFSYMRERFLDFSEKWGYMEISPPIIENSDLFKRKSGETFVSDLYQFSDPSGMNVSLRPEYTSSIMRMVIEEDMYELDQDLRFSYSGEIYRYDRKSKKNYIMQNGIEIIGNKNPITDTEIIALSYLFSKEILGQNPLISVGNIGILFDIMKYFKVSERESLFLLKNIDQLGSNFDQNNLKTLATEFGLFFENGTAIALVNKFSVKEINKLLDFEIDNNKKFSQTRDKESILDNLIRKASTNTTEAQFFECVEILSRVISIDKNIEESISEVGEIIKDISDKKSLTSLYNIVKNLEQYGIDLSSVKLDYGLVRDWGYYSSLVFNLYVNSYDSHNLFGGGGRYDNLGQSLGLDEDLPALGFAIDSEKLLSFSKIQLPKIKTKKIVVLLDDSKNLKQALEICFLERNKGNISYVETKFNNQENLDNWGKENKIHEIITLNGEEIDRRKI